MDSDSSDGDSSDSGDSGDGGDQFNIDDDMESTTADTDVPAESPEDKKKREDRERREGRENDEREEVDIEALILKIQGQAQEERGDQEASLQGPGSRSGAGSPSAPVSRPRAQVSVPLRKVTEYIQE